VWEQNSEFRFFKNCPSPFLRENKKKVQQHIELSLIRKSKPESELYMVITIFFSCIFFRSQVFKRRGANLPYSQAQEKIFLFLCTIISDTPLTCWKMHPWYWLSPIRSITNTDFIQKILQRVQLANAPPHFLNSMFWTRKKRWFFAAGWFFVQFDFLCRT
jgi:hypothetical protein